MSQENNQHILQRKHAMIQKRTMGCASGLHLKQVVLLLVGVEVTKTGIKIKDRN